MTGLSDVWVVRVATTEKNFPQKREAIAWLRTLAADTRIRPMVRRDAAGAYTFYGPGRGEVVMKAEVARVSLPSIRRRPHPADRSLPLFETESEG